MPVLDHVGIKRASHNTKLGDGESHLFGRTLIDFNSIRDDAQRQGLNLRLSFYLCGPVSKHARQALDLSDPAAVLFPVKSDLKFHVIDYALRR